MASSHSSSALKITAEYAKSGRSSCKQCAKIIAASSLRLGLVSRDSRGFDMTKWHHLKCFPLKFDSNVSPESIKGFSLLKVTMVVAHRGNRLSRTTFAKIKDQEELKKMMEGVMKKELEVVKRDDDAHDEQEEKCVKKQKLSDSDGGGEFELVFSDSDVKDMYKDATLSPPWKAFQTIIFLERVDGLHDSRKIAAFDFDGCLAQTSVKRTGADAWSLMYPTIPEKLQKLYNDGFKLVIFTNESNIERWKNKRQAAVDSKVGRLNNFIKCVDVPIQVFIACGLSYGQPEDHYRKPKPGMWHIMEKHFNSGLQIDMNCSFYVGDAAGRPEDHSDADIKFAEAVGLKFYVPEEYFSS